jgi:ABC-type multidrug transport system ATPase subunit
MGGYFNGDICVNGRALDPSNFGKIGAYVQQDDVLVSTMTPLECFTFAAKLRTTLNP